MHYLVISGWLPTLLCFLNSCVVVLYIGIWFNYLDEREDVYQLDVERWKLGCLLEANLTPDQSLELHRRAEELPLRLEIVMNIKKYL